MPNGVFNSKYFNEKAFGAYYDTIPQERLNLLIKSGILQPNRRIKELFSNQTGSEYGIIPMTGRLKGKPVNYDGTTSYGNAKTLTTYKQGVICIGRKDKFFEDDFTYDVTSKKDFMSQIADQLADYWDTAWEDILMTIVSGLFAMTSTAGQEFILKHTHDITGQSTTVMEESTLNTALQKACGDRRRKFAVVCANSLVCSNLENKKLVTNLRYNDANGIERDLNLYTWNGKILVEYDAITEQNGYVTSTSSTTGALLVVADSATPSTGEIKLGDVKASDYYPAGVKATDYVLADTRYVTYVFGKGAFDYEDIGAKKPHEMFRDADNDRDYLYERQRKVIMPHGISYLMQSQVTDSPTDAELANGANWDLVMGSDNAPYDHREIAIARIISKG